MRALIIAFAALMAVGCRSHREVAVAVDSAKVRVVERQVVVTDTVWRTLALRADTVTVTLTDTVTTLRAVGVSLASRSSSSSRLTGNVADSAVSISHSDRSQSVSQASPTSPIPWVLLTVAVIIGIVVARCFPRH